MISTNRIKPPISKEEILKYVSEEQIFRKFIPYEFKIGETFCATYREDNNPSFGVYYNRHFNKLMFKDLSRHIGGDCFSYVKLAHNSSFWEALLIIDQSFNLGLHSSKIGSKELIKLENEYKCIKKPKEIGIVPQSFTIIDKEYWSQFYINSSTLRLYNVSSCYKVLIDNKLVRIYTPYFPMYAFHFPKTNHYKIYIPNETKSLKWLTNANNELDIIGYDQLPKNGELVYITKSMKDVMVLYELGIPAVATHGEGQYFNPDFIRHLKGRFKKVVLFYDNDKEGKICGDKIAEMYSLEKFYLEGEEKDISDFIKKYGKDKGREVLNHFSGIRA